MPPIEKSKYHRFQDAVVPGVAELHRMACAIFEASLSEQSRILISGAGGGRELETLGASPQAYRLLGIDPSPEMLELARVCIAKAGLNARVTLVEGVVSDLPASLYDGATSFFVMHYLPDDGAKAGYLGELRKRLRLGAVYLHVDVCYDTVEEHRQLAAVFKRHAELGGLPPDEASRVAILVEGLPIIPEKLLLERLHQAGFRPVAPFYRALWYTGWWCEAA